MPESYIISYDITCEICSFTRRFTWLETSSQIDAGIHHTIREACENRLLDDGWRWPSYWLCPECVVNEEARYLSQNEKETRYA